MRGALVAEQRFTVRAAEFYELAGIQAAYAVFVYQFSLHKYGFRILGGLRQKYS